MPALFQADKQIAAPQPIAFIGIKPLTNPFANVIKPALGGKIVSASEIEQQVVDDVLPEDEQVVEEEQIVEAEVEVEQAVEEPVEAASEEPAVVEERIFYRTLGCSKAKPLWTPYIGRGFH